MTLALRVWFVLAMLTTGSRSQFDIRLPPKIQVPGRARELYYNQDANFVVPCQADGYPKPTYQWYFNSSPIVDSDHVKYDSVSGYLSLTSFSKREEGVYMCVASNVFDNPQGGRITATSFSPPQTLHQFRVPPFTPAPDNIVKAQEYAYTTLKCSGKGDIVGDDIAYNWYESKESKDVNLDGGRLFVDKDGNLHFSYVLFEDRTDTFTYLCGISSPSNKVIRLGNINLLDVDLVTSPLSLGPQLQYSNSGQKGLLYGQARLECLFSG